MGVDVTSSNPLASEVIPDGMHAQQAFVNINTEFIQPGICFLLLGQINLTFRQNTSPATRFISIHKVHTAGNLLLLCQLAQSLMSLGLYAVQRFRDNDVPSYRVMLMYAIAQSVLSREHMTVSRDAR